MPHNESKHDNATRDHLLVAKALNSHFRSQQNEPGEQDQAWEQFAQNSEVKNKTALLEAIDSDPDKFKQWLQSQPLCSQKQSDPSFFEQIFGWLKNPWVLPTAFASIVLFSMLMLNLFQQPLSPLQSSYQQVVDLIRKEKQPAAPLPLLNIQGESLSFSSSGSQKDARIQAFLSGVEAGSEQLQMKDYSKHKDGLPHKTWQELGQWYQLNRYVVNQQYQLNSQYWQHQQAILSQLQSDLGSSPSLKPIHKALQDLQQNPFNPRHLLRLKQGLTDYWIALQVSQNVQ